MNKFKAFGEIKTCKEWSNDKRCVVTFGTLTWRFRNGWDEESAITTNRFGIKDLTGKEFGHLKVKKQVESSVWRNTQWECECVCGNIVYIIARVLNKGKKIHCGCKGYTGIIPGFMFSIIMSRVLNRGGYYNITYEHLCDIWKKQEGICALTGEQLYFGKNRSDHDVRTASLDRIDSTQGYIIGNVRWVDKWINCMRLDHNDTEFIEMCRKVVEYNDKNTND